MPDFIVNENNGVTSTIDVKEDDVAMNREKSHVIVSHKITRYESLIRSHVRNILRVTRKESCEKK